MMGDTVSFLSGVALMVMGVLVMRAYLPGAGWHRTGQGVLGAAIFISFLVAVLNTLYWQVFGQVAVEFLGIMTVAQLRAVGDWVDLVVKGGAAWAAYLHLKAMWMRLPDEERARWRVIEMPWYPARRWCLVKLAQGLKRRGKE